MGKKINFNLGGEKSSGSDPSTISLISKVDALVKWCNLTGNDIERLKNMVFSFVASFESLVDLLIKDEEVTSEAILERRNALLEEWAEIAQTSQIWTPGDDN